jgi:hypothetical protein
MTSRMASWPRTSKWDSDRGAIPFTSAVSFDDAIGAGRKYSQMCTASDTLSSFPFQLRIQLQVMKWQRIPAVLFIRMFIWPRNGYIQSSELDLANSCHAMAMIDFCKSLKMFGSCLIVGRQPSWRMLSSDGSRNTHFFR